MWRRGVQALMLPQCSQVSWLFLRGLMTMCREGWGTNKMWKAWMCSTKFSCSHTQPMHVSHFDFFISVSILPLHQIAGMVKTDTTITVYVLLWIFLCNLLDEGVGLIFCWVNSLGYECTDSCHVCLDSARTDTIVTIKCFVWSSLHSYMCTRQQSVDCSVQRHGLWFADLQTSK